MARGGNKLMKLKSVIKKLNSFNTKHSQRSTVSAVADSSPDDYAPASASGDLHEVYVGKSRRRYLVSSDVFCHPTFRQLAHRSTYFGDNNGNGNPAAVNISCEVVLFEHLLWMLENGDDPRPDELVEFYAC